MKSDLAEAVAEGAGHLGGRVGGPVGHILEQAAQVPLAHQPRESLRHVVEEAQRVPQEVCRAQDEHSLREKEKEDAISLTGLSHEIDLTFDDKYRYL